ncbi:MAG: polyprenyl synthetase family protein, partial [Bdellovibrionales bacterium]|nr:polyprenyl synthetase family protein [Bdellovibrionales bacterium]
MSGLDIVDRVIDELICEFSDDQHRDSLRHHFSTGGKKLRARLALAAVNALGGIEENGILWGAACELLHNATLIHDDLQDGDRVRRGKPTVWAKYGASQAINAGDSCLMFPFLALRTLKVSDSTKWQLSKVLSAGAALTVRGQALELELPSLCAEGVILESKYLKCIAEKTSALFEVPVT